MTGLDGRSRWLLWPLSWALAAAAVPAAVYLWLAVPLPSGDSSLTVTACATACLAMVALWALWAQAQVKTVRYVANGRWARNAENLGATLREIRALPERLHRSTVILCIGFSVSSALALHTVSQLPLPALVRVGVLGALLGPVAGLMAHALAVHRSRRLLGQLAGELPTRDVVAALKEASPRPLRVALLRMVTTLVILPAALMFDAARVAGRDVLAAVAAEPSATQELLGQALWVELAARLVLLAVVLIAVSVGVGFAAGRNLADPMRRVAEEATRMSRGDLRHPQWVVAEGELWEIASTFSQMQAQLGRVLGQLQRAGLSIGSTTEQLLATSSRYQAGATEQATSLNQTSATTEELAQSARQISASAGAVSELAQKTLEAAQAGQGSAAAFVASVARMQHDNESISSAVRRLQKRVQQIGRIVEFITTVADRSDLLALSAELEGTKAGDVGRGFTLVAAEMRRLAENVIESTNEIEELISEIREATAATVAATATGSEQTSAGTALAATVSKALEGAVALAQGTSDSVRAISMATQQQRTSTDQLAEAMADILSVTQQSLAATKQVTHANQELITLSVDLKAMVERFQVNR